jgi:hypothetical protein
MNNIHKSLNIKPMKTKNLILTIIFSLLLSNVMYSQDDWELDYDNWVLHTSSQVTIGDQGIRAIDNPRALKKSL